MDNRKEAIKILEGAIKVLKENDLSKGWYAVDALGNNVDILSDNATSFCFLGSMYRSAGINIDYSGEKCSLKDNPVEDIIYDIAYEIGHLIDDKSMVEYNDRDDIDKEDIIKMFEFQVRRIKENNTCIQQNC